MGTVTKEIADDIIAGKYPDEEVVRIVQYTSAWGTDCYGVVAPYDPPDKYLREGTFIINPKVYWDWDVPAREESPKRTEMRARLAQLQATRSAGDTHE